MYCAGSILAALWRILLMPLDTCKTVLQVEGQRGFNMLLSQVLTNGNIGRLYQGAFGRFIGYFFLNIEVN